jgi:hypothetical protein
VIDGCLLFAGNLIIYKYRFDGSGTAAECRKYRGSKKYRSSDVPSQLAGRRDPDYWEPTKRVAVDGMSELPKSGFDSWPSESRDRWNQIEKNVLYLDFRSELSAFDKFIHHQSFDRWTRDSTQKRYRAVLRSKWIAKALSGESLPQAQRHRLVTPLRYLGAFEVDQISTILGKPVDKIAIVEHTFFGPIGFTVRLYLQGSGTAYSEAHAGSGEYAVVRLVDAIRSASSRSLILLDEPEVSLHPGAQTELMKFLERETLRQGHQVVISTHSPVLAAGLPPKAIKVFGFDSNRQRVVMIANGCSATEAFAHLGHTTSGPTRPRIIVEDELAAEIVRAALRRHAPVKLNTLNIVAFPGGANGLVQHVLSTFAIAKVEKAGILLDGDQRVESSDGAIDVPAVADLAEAQSDFASLSDLWVKQFHQTLPNLHSHSDGSNSVKVLRSCIGWANVHLGFLPGASPEAALAIAMDPALAAEVVDWKSFWERLVREQLHLTDSETVTSLQILAKQQAELANLAAGCDLLSSVHQTVELILDW